MTMDADAAAAPSSRTDEPVASGIRRHRAWAVVATFVCAYFLVQLFADGHSWARLGMPDEGPRHFQDLRTVTSAWECTRRGIDVLPLDPCYPQLAYDYPRVWLLPS